MDVYLNIFESAPDAIIVVDLEGRIWRANTQVERLFGYPRDELIGQPVEVLIPSRYADRHVGHRTRYTDAPRLRPMGAGLDLYAKRKDGSEFPVDLMLSPLATAEGTFVLGVVRDITERKQVQQRILDSLREKEILLKEIHHRVKNNLAVVSSLLYLQSAHTDDQRAIRILQESQNRVRSMALVHETLYQSRNLSAVDFAHYAQVLCGHLLHTYGATAGTIEYETDVKAVDMGIDAAVPCGLILNELISNSMKHAFPGGRKGRILVSAHQDAEGRFTMRVVDDGVGMPTDHDSASSRSLGMQLIGSLARQLGATFELRPRDTGTEALLTFEIERHARH